jgi:mono/diheme cytochrome c family protein
VSARRISVLVIVAGLSACSRAPSPAPPAIATPAAAAPAAPAPLLDYETRLGRDVYVHYCSTCHGDAGAGDGFNAYNLDPHPRDFSDPAFQKKKTDTELADAIRRGGAGVGLSNLMPPWGHTLTERQIRQVTAYLRTLRKTAP